MKKTILTTLLICIGLLAINSPALAYAPAPEATGPYQNGMRLGIDSNGYLNIQLSTAVTTSSVSYIRVYQDGILTDGGRMYATSYTFQTAWLPVGDNVVYSYPHKYRVQIEDSNGNILVGPSEYQFQDYIPSTAQWGSLIGTSGYRFYAGIDQKNGHVLVRWGGSTYQSINSSYAFWIYDSNNMNNKIGQYTFSSAFGGYKDKWWDTGIVIPDGHSAAVYMVYAPLSRIDAGPAMSPIYLAPPAKPISTVSDITTNSATINWSSIPNALTYDVFLNDILVANIEQTSFNLTNLLDGQLYTASVIAKSSIGNSEPGQVTFSTQALANPPDGLRATNITTSTIDLSWNAVDGAISYILDENGYVLGSTLNTFYHLTDLTPDTTYIYKVAVVTSVGQSRYSNPVEVTTFGLPPESPTGLSYTDRTGTSFKVYWLRQPDVNSYKVFGNGNFIQEIPQTIMFNPSYTFSDLNLGSENIITIVAVNDWGESSASQPLIVKTKNVPNSPVNLYAYEIYNDRFTLSWNPNDSVDEVVGYRVYLNEQPYGDMVLSSVKSFTGLSRDSSYSITVTAVNALGESAHSESVTVTTTDTEFDIPTAVTNLNVRNPRATSVDVLWDSIKGADYYEVIDVNSGKIIATPTSANANLDGLSPEKSYSIQVRAHNPIGYGDYSDVLTFKTPPEPLDLGLDSNSILDNVSPIAKPIGGILAFSTGLSGVIWIAFRLKNFF